MTKKKNTRYKLNKVDYAILIICSAVALILLYLFYKDLNSYSIKQNEEPIAKIYFKKNTAQRKFADSDIWSLLQNPSDIYDGDKIRTSMNSEAYTEFPDSDVKIQLREKSMVQIFKNKKEQALDFISGEIYVESTSKTDKFIIRADNKEIAVSQKSQARIVRPEDPENKNGTVNIEVMSGKIEVSDLSDGKKKNNASEKLVIKGGEDYTVSLSKSISSPEAYVNRSEIAEANLHVDEDFKDEYIYDDAGFENSYFENDYAPEPGVFNWPESSGIIEEIVEKTEAAVNAVVNETKSAIKKAEEYFQPAPKKTAPEPEAKTETENLQPQANETEEQEDEKKPGKYEVIENGFESTVEYGKATFDYNLYNSLTKESNHEFGHSLNDFAPNKTIPKGSVIEVEMSGIPDHDLSRFAIQIADLTGEWERVHEFSDIYPNAGEGLKKGVPFVQKKRFVLTGDIENTKRSNIGFSYDPPILDDPMSIENLKITVRVLTLDSKELEETLPEDFKWSHTYENIAFEKIPWGKGENDFDYEFHINTDEIFGSSVHIPAGTKVKISINGVSNKKINWLWASPVGNVENQYRTFFLEGNDYYAMRISDNPIQPGARFSVSKVYTFKTDMQDTIPHSIRIDIPHDAGEDGTAFTNAEITVELVK